MNETAANLPPNKSELDLTQFSLEKFEGSSLPMITQAKVVFECALDQVVSFENSDMFIGIINTIHMDPEVYEEGSINIEKLSPIGRLSGNAYTTLGNVINLRRPTK